MKNKFNKHFTLLKLILVTNLFICGLLYECDKNQPIFYDNHCVSTYCTEEQYKSGECIISEEITKTQWLTNIIKFEKTNGFFSLIKEDTYKTVLFVVYSSDNNEKIYFNMHEKDDYCLFEDCIYYRKSNVDGDYEVLNPKLYILQVKRPYRNYIVSIGTINSNISVLETSRTDEDYMVFNPALFLNDSNRIIEGIESLCFYYGEDNFVYSTIITKSNDPSNYYLSFYNYNIENLDIMANLFSFKFNSVKDIDLTKGKYSSCIIIDENVRHVSCFYLSQNNFYTIIVVQNSTNNFTVENKIEVERPSNLGQDNIYFLKAISLGNYNAIYSYYSGNDDNIPTFLMRKINSNDYSLEELYSEFPVIYLYDYVFNKNIKYNDLTVISEREFFFVSTDNNKDILIIANIFIYENPSDIYRLIIRYYTIKLKEYYYIQILNGLKAIIYKDIHLAIGFDFCNYDSCQNYGEDINNAGLFFLSYANRTKIQFDYIEYIIECNTNFFLTNISDIPKIEVDNNIFGYVPTEIKIKDLDDSWYFNCYKLEDTEFYDLFEYIDVYGSTITSTYRVKFELHEEEYSLEDFNIYLPGYKFYSIEVLLEEPSNISEYNKYCDNINDTLGDKNYTNSYSHKSYTFLIDYHIKMEYHLSTVCNDDNCTLCLEEDDDYCLICKDDNYIIKYGDYKYGKIKICKQPEIETTLIKDESLKEIDTTINIISTNINIESTMMDIQTTNIVIESTIMDIQTTNINIESTNIDIKTTNIVIESTNIDIITTNIVIESTINDIQTTIINIKSTINGIETTNINIKTTNIGIQTTNINIQSTNNDIVTTNINIESIINISTTNIDIESTNINIPTTNRVIESTNIDIQTTNRVIESTNIDIQTTIIVIESTDINIPTTNINIESTIIDIQTTNIVIESTNNDIQITNIVIESTDINIHSSNANIESTIIETNIIIESSNINAQSMDINIESTNINIPSSINQQFTDISKNSNKISVEDLFGDKYNEVNLSNEQIKEVYEVIKDYIYNDYNGENKIIKTGNADIQISKLDSQLESELSNVDLGKCTEIIKEKYCKSDNDTLVMLKFDITPENEKSTYVQYEVYEQISKQFLELKECTGTNVVINSPIELDSYIESLYNMLSKTGYNLFDANDSFYNDVCAAYTTENGTDILLYDRRMDIYQTTLNISLCQEGCKFLSYDSETKKAECNCPIQTKEMDLELSNLHFEKNEMLDEFYETLKNSNFRVLKCYELIYNFQVFKNNIGCIIMSLLLFLFNILAIIYLVKNTKKINYFIQSILKKKFVDNENSKSFLSNRGLNLSCYNGSIDKEEKKNKIINISKNNKKENKKENRKENKNENKKDNKKDSKKEKKKENKKEEEKKEKNKKNKKNKKKKMNRKSAYFINKNRLNLEENDDLNKKKKKIVIKILFWPLLNIKK